MARGKRETDKGGTAVAEHNELDNNGKVVRFDADQVTNGGKRIIESGEPYIAAFEITGTAPILLHGWNIEAVESKGNAAKGSKAKKTDDIESYVFRDPQRNIGVPMHYICSALSDAGRSMQDPRSPRKSFRDLLRAILIPMPTPDTVAPFLPKTKEWEFVHRGRVVVQRAAITRSRPAFQPGWRIGFEVLVNAPEYLAPQSLQELINKCGRLNGFCDGRPSYGRFTLSQFETKKLED